MFSSRNAGNSYLEQKVKEVSSSTWFQVVLPSFSPSQAIFTSEFSLTGCVQAIRYILIFKPSLEFFLCLAATPPYCKKVSSSADSEDIYALIYDSFWQKSRSRSANSTKWASSPMNYILLAMVFILILIKWDFLTAIWCWQRRREWPYDLYFKIPCRTARRRNLLHLFLC